MRFDRVVKGGNVVTPGGRFVGDVGIVGERSRRSVSRSRQRAPRSWTRPVIM